MEKSGRFRVLPFLSALLVERSRVPRIQTASSGTRWCPISREVGSSPRSGFRLVSTSTGGLQHLVHEFPLMLDAVSFASSPTESDVEGVNAGLDHSSSQLPVTSCAPFREAHNRAASAQGRRACRHRRVLQGHA